MNFSAVIATLTYFYNTRISINAPILSKRYSQGPLPSKLLQADEIESVAPFTRCGKLVPPLLSSLFLSVRKGSKSAALKEALRDGKSQYAQFR